MARAIALRWHQLILGLGCLLLIIACNNLQMVMLTTSNSNPKLLKVATAPTFFPFFLRNSSIFPKQAKLVAI